MESDVVLLDLNSVIAQFQDDGDKKLSYPLETESLGCASLFIVRNLSFLEKFLEYTLSSWEKPETTDMTLLGSFAQEEVDCVEILPTWIKNRSLKDSFFLMQEQLESSTWGVTHVTFLNLFREEVLSRIVLHWLRICPH